MPKKRILFVFAFSSIYHLDATRKVHQDFGNTNRISILCLKDTIDFQRFAKEYDLKPNKGNIVVLHYHPEHKVGGGELNGFFCAPVYFNHAKEGWLCDDGDGWKNTVKAIRENLK